MIAVPSSPLCTSGVSRLGEFLTYESAGLTTTTWAPTVDLDAYGTLTINGAPVTVDANWNGSGKKAVNTVGRRMRYNESGVGLSRRARTITTVGNLGSGNNRGMWSLRGPYFGTYYSNGGEDMGLGFGGTVRLPIANVGAFLGRPFALSLSIVSTSELLGHFICDGVEISGSDTGSNIGAALLDWLVIGGWDGGSSSWNDYIAAVSFSDVSALSGAPGLVELRDLARSWASRYLIPY